MAKKTKIKTKFDWSGFWLLLGIGVVLSGIGTLIIWATYTAPEGGGTESFALSTSQRIARMLPEDTQSILAFILAGLFVVFGIALVLSAFYRAIRYVVVRR